MGCHASPFLYSIFTVSCGNMGGGEKVPFKRQAFKRKKVGLLLAIDEVQVLHHGDMVFHSQNSVL